MVGSIFAGLNVQATPPALEEAIEEWEPDLVLREPNEYASAIAAERHRVAHARVAISLALVEEGALASLRRRSRAWSRESPTRSGARPI